MVDHADAAARAGDRAAHTQRLIASRRDGHGLPRAFYHDSILYTHEMERIWRHGWVFVGHTCQIPRPGNYVTLTLDGDPLIVLRDDEGAIRAFHNICTHRGTVLCDDEDGQGRAIVCPYHQWAFSLSGALLSCRGMQDDIDKGALGLRPVHLETCAGLIFISLAEIPPPFAPAREVMAPFAAPQGLERAKVAVSVDYEIQANWKLVWENNRECYHCNVNHPQYIKSNFDIYEDGHGSALFQRRLTAALTRGEAAWEAEGLAISHRQGGLALFPDADNNVWYSATRTVLTEGYESESLDGRRVAPLMGSYRHANVGVLRLRTLPNFWNHSSCDHAVSTRLLPAGPRATRARVTWLVHEDAEEGVDYNLDDLMPFWQLTSEQDWELCERVQRGVDSTAYRPGPLSQAREYNLDAFLRWYLHQLT
jgi:Rieske 2Fe-2S family protein